MFDCNNSITYNTNRSRNRSISESTTTEIFRGYHVQQQKHSEGANKLEIFLKYHNRCILQVATTAVLFFTRYCKKGTSEGTTTQVQQT